MSINCDGLHAKNSNMVVSTSTKIDLNNTSINNSNVSLVSTGNNNAKISVKDTRIDNSNIVCNIGPSNHEKEESTVVNSNAHVGTTSSSQKIEDKRGNLPVIQENSGTSSGNMEFVQRNRGNCNFQSPESMSFVRGNSDASTDSDSEDDVQFIGIKTANNSETSIYQSCGNRGCSNIVSMSSPSSFVATTTSSSSPSSSRKRARKQSSPKKRSKVTDEFCGSTEDNVNSEKASNEFSYYFNNGSHLYTKDGQCMYTSTKGTTVRLVSLTKKTIAKGTLPTIVSVNGDVKINGHSILYWKRRGKFVTKRKN